MPPLVRRLILCACAAAGFAAMAALLHRVAPWRVPEVTRKLDYVKAHRGDFDTVFIGSSRIYHGVSPRVFDAAMAAGGRETRSFNLGVDGMMPPESLHMTRAFLAMGPPKLRRVFLEVEAARGIPDLDSPTVRDIYWHDLDALEEGWQRALLDYRTTPRKYRWQRAWKDMSRNAALFTRNELNMGRLIPTPDFAPRAPGKPAESWLGPDRDGYLPEVNPLTETERAKLEKGIEAVRQATARARPIDPLNQEQFARIRDLLEERGVELILIATPVATRGYLGRQDAPPGTKLLAFDDPDRHPELYEPERRVDSGHLNDDGARLFSREVAEAYLAEK